ncbi:MAG: iron-sulfur cluster-binding domain-containing protein, partial [Chitinophagaceae bacterium]
MTGKQQQLVITRIIQETAAAKTFVLHPVDGIPTAYQPGQFLTFIFDSPFGEQRRNYSISGSVIAGDPLSITIKRVVNGTYSRSLLDHAKVGDVLTTIGAGGLFTLPEGWRNYRQIFFLAAGSGITPVFSLIRTILYARADTRIVLIYSNKSEGDTIFHKQLLSLQNEFPNSLSIVWLYSNLLHHKKSRLNNTLLQEIIAGQLNYPMEQCLFYTCGPHDYMRMIRITLLILGVKATNIRKEEFVTSLPIQRQLPPDRNQHPVEVSYESRTASFSAGYPLTILDAGLKAGVDLPYSCKTGRCGTCVAHCSSGQVWIEHNEVLTAADISNGLVLTCTGYPVNG